MGCKPLVLQIEIRVQLDIPGDDGALKGREVVVLHAARWAPSHLT